MAKNKKKERCTYSGIGGQAVLEGVMMRNGALMAVAVRKPDQEIEVEVEEHHSAFEKSAWTKLPLIRGVFNFVDSLAVGIRSLNISSSYYVEDEEEKEKEKDEDTKKREEKITTVLTTVFSVALAVGLFMLLPYFLTELLRKVIRSAGLLAVVEGVLRLLIFLGYIIGISALKDIRRLYQYHGAEHKCINCIENGHPLTVRNVRASSRFHRRCGTSFLILVMLISIVLFFFIRVPSPVGRLLLRLAMIPVIAGISYEFIRFAGRHDNFLVRIISAPGVWLQHVTTREPDNDMIEVGIASVEAVFDWREYLVQNFGYNRNDLP